MENKDILLAQMAVLPPALASFVAHGEWGQKLQPLKTTYNLSDEQMQSLKTEVFLVLVSSEHKNDLVNAVIREVRVDRLVAEKIVSDINRLVFNDIEKLLSQGWKRAQNAESWAREQHQALSASKERIFKEAEKPKILVPTPAPTQTPKPFVPQKTPVTPNVPKIPTNLPTGTNVPSFIQKTSPTPTQRLFANTPRQATVDIPAKPAQTAVPKATFLDKKLNQVVNIPSEQIKVVERPKVYNNKYDAADPYREAI